MSSIEQREISISLGIVVEKRESAHPWADSIWAPVSAYLCDPGGEDWRELARGDKFVRYHATTLLLTLHRKETEALRLNLMLPEPELYVVLQENDADTDGRFPYYPKFVTASSYDAQDFDDADGNLMEKVAMPEAVAALVQAFVEEHHVEQKFVKRRRDEVNQEEQKFGKEPIFASPLKH